MRLIRGLVALVVLTVGLVAVPVFLIVAVGNPLPSDLDLDGLIGGLTRPDDGSILVGLVTIVAWVAWAIFAATVVVEVIAVLSRQRLQIRLPGLMAPQRLASGLVVAVVALVVVTPQLGHATPARATPAMTQDDAPRAAVAPAKVAPAVAADRANPARDHRERADVPRATGTRYTVERGDDLWSLAERFYGAGRDWRKIAAANPDLLTGGPDRLEPGWRLLIPDVEKSPTSPTVVVEPGDSLSSIAHRLWSDADRWPEVYEANRFQLDDPDELPVGLTLVLPERSADTQKDAADSPTPGADSGSRAETEARSDEPVDRGSSSTGREPDALPRPRPDRSGGAPGAVCPGHSGATSCREFRSRFRPGALPGSALAWRSVGGRPARGRAGRGQRSAGGRPDLRCRTASSRTAASPACGPKDPAAITGCPAG